MTAETLAVEFAESVINISLKFEHSP